LIDFSSPGLLIVGWYADNQVPRSLIA